jgi:hypothetical protein
VAIAVVSAVDPPVSRLASSSNRDVTVSGAAALNSRYGDGSISLHAGLDKMERKLKKLGLHSREQVAAPMTNRQPRQPNPR